jgi:hypothetical protein
MVSSLTALSRQKPNFPFWFFHCSFGMIARSSYAAYARIWIQSRADLARSSWGTVGFEAHA